MTLSEALIQGENRRKSIVEVFRDGEKLAFSRAFENRNRSKKQLFQKA
jgi:hypothetical protein